LSRPESRLDVHEPQAVDPAEVDLSVDIAGLTLRNPMVTCSGTCGYGLEYAAHVNLSELGAFTTKSITPEERAGNRPERIVETSAGMLNAIGLANVGLQRFIAEKLPLLPQLGCPVLVNVAGHRLEDYLEVCQALDAHEEIAGLELNVSCPNVADGLYFGTDPERLQALVTAVRERIQRCVLVVKLSPNVTDICALARAAIAGGADALSMVNTFMGLAIHTQTWRPLLANGSGGLSGPAIKPLALHLIHQVYRHVARDAGVPIIGMGGMRSWQDAVEFALAGATGLGVGTALFVDPRTPLKIAEGLRAYLAGRGLRRFRDLVGKLKLDA
jgi:dihydroorotate dehydrogenase (NAD+) catalytic subunit